MYNLPTTVDPNKIFLIKQSELDGRYDPTFYKLKEKVLSNFKFPLEKIGNSFFVKDGDHDKLPANAIADSSNGKRYLRSQDLKGNTIIDENPIFVTDEYFQCVKRCHIYPGDLLFSIMASLGATAIVPESYPICTANRAVGILRQKEKAKILPSFVQALLDTNLGFSLLELEKRGAIQQRLNLSDLAMLKLPTPDIEYQKEIVQVYRYGISKKQQKEAEAKALLESIDTYLLGELGISLPEQVNSLEKRIFTKRYSELAGERLDSIFYASDLMLFYSGKYSSVPLKSVSISFKSGVGAGKQDQAIGQNGIIQIRPTNIDENGLLKFDRNIYLPFEAKADTLDVDDVLFNNTNSQELVGKTAILKEQKELCYSNHITRIKVDQNKLVPDFLWVILNIYQKNKVFYSICTNWNNQSGIGLELLKSLKIPLPPIKKQSEIAIHIQNIHSRAKALQHEAARVLEEAKREVEKMILGE
ncbi:MAG: restriction endonuclease subunit S [Prolixibacteraceae bacterium]|nr:restriction endonuclease subunit S [Prolixibacteraceae bacterium]